MNEEEANKTCDRLKNHPEILEGVKELLDISEGIKGIQRADDAEYALIPEVRGLGKKCLQDWANNQANAVEESSKKTLKLHSKKK